MKNFLLVLCFSYCLTPFLNAQCDIDGVAITSVLIDPNSSSNNFDTDGDGNFEADDEFIEICNNSGVAVDISGWTLGDDDGGPFSFPAGTVLAAGDCAMIVRDWDGGAGIPPMVFDMDNGSGFLANGGDILELSDGVNTCEVSYGSTSCGGANCDDWGSDTDGCALLAGGADCAYSPSPLSNPLPVTLTHFSAKPMDTKEVALHWATSSEQNNDYFIIEHSTDGRDFIELDYVNGAGTTVEAQQYAFMHKEATQGANYYRLRQVDFDGEFAYSSVEVVNIQSATTIAVRPTLARDVINIDLGAEANSNTIAEIINLNGQVVKTSLFEQGVLSQEIVIADLQSGYYFVRINSGNAIETLKFIKQ